MLAASDQSHRSTCAIERRLHRASKLPGQRRFRPALSQIFPKQAVKLFDNSSEDKSRINQKERRVCSFGMTHACIDPQKVRANLNMRLLGAFGHATAILFALAGLVSALPSAAHADFIVSADHYCSAGTNHAPTSDTVP